ncbi:MAG TPA: glycine--tRNA ligase subunit beta, partial [Burkholderiales bacterium]|nr:glycine--tRNA ligase subunit beta [Burkholderiales bacterium]
MPDALLVEIFTEELPPKALPRLAAAFAEEVLNGLVQAQLKETNPGGIRRFATPRRLGVLVPGVLRNAPDRREEKKLMPAKVAFDPDGKPTTALLKRLEKEGESAESVGKLERRSDAGTEQVFLSRFIPGAELGSALQQVLEQAVAALPIPKVMRYQTEGEQVEFIRPAHGLVALHGSEIVPVIVLQLQAGRVTHGHRFQGAQNITLAHAEEYESKLRTEGGVIASFEERREEIIRQLVAQASSLSADLRLDERTELLDEVAALVEFPTVYVGEFEQEFLAVPQECLILTMQQNQKYFPLFGRDGRLLNRFLIVSNMRLEDPANI